MPAWLRKKRGDCKPDTYFKCFDMDTQGLSVVVVENRFDLVEKLAWQEVCDDENFRFDRYLKQGAYTTS